MSDPLNLEAALADLGDRILARTKADLGDVWTELPQDAKDGVVKAAKRIAELTAKSALTGENPTAELAHAYAQVANWTWVGAEFARKAFLRAVRDVVQDAAMALGVILGTFARGALENLARGEF